MNIWESAAITLKGLALQSKLTQGNTLRITRAVAGTGYVNPALLIRQTAVQGIKQTLSFKAASYPEEGKCALPLFLTNDGLTTGYTAKQLGIYAEDPDEGEILYFICQATSGNGTIIPSATEMPGYHAEWTFYFQYGQADGVSVTVDPANTINKKEAQELVDAHANKKDNPHKVTKEQLGLGSVDNTADANKVVKSAGDSARLGGQLPSYYAKKTEVDNAQTTANNAMPKTVTVKTAGTDLNDYTEDGFYFFDGSVTPANIPRGTNGWLLVMNSGTSTTKIKQVWFRSGDPNITDYQICERTYFSTVGWTEWVELMTSQGGAFTGAVDFKANNMDINTTPSSSKYCSTRFVDVNGTVIGNLQMTQGSDGNNIISLIVYNKNGGSNIFRVLIDNNGNTKATLNGNDIITSAGGKFNGVVLSSGLASAESEAIRGIGVKDSSGNYVSTRRILGTRKV